MAMVRSCICLVLAYLVQFCRYSVGWIFSGIIWDLEAGTIYVCIGWALLLAAVLFGFGFFALFPSDYILQMVLIWLGFLPRGRELLFGSGIDHCQRDASLVLACLVAGHDLYES